jgi:putative intracellular protease/amidase
MGTMKSNAYLVVFDGLADWEPAHAVCEINKSGKLNIVTVGFSEKPVVTMGGLKVTPEISIGDVNPAEAGILILPGGDMWEQTSDEGLVKLLNELHKEGTPIAAICGATLEIARAGLTHGTHHTSNAKGYLKAFVPDYKDEAFYVEELAVTDKNLITASGLGSVDFGREVIKKLGIYTEAETEEWFGMFKHGVIPTGHAV